MKALVLLTFAVVAATAIGSKEMAQTQLVSDNFIKEINSKAETWVAGHNFHPETPLSYFQSLLPKYSGNKKVMYNCSIFGKTNSNLGSLVGELPTSFDPREKWPTCKSISMVWNQANCGTCWIFSATSAMSDRLCIHSGGKLQTLVSPENVKNCIFLIMEYTLEHVRGAQQMKCGAYGANKALSQAVPTGAIWGASPTRFSLASVLM